MNIEHRMKNKKIIILFSHCIAHKIAVTNKFNLEIEALENKIEIKSKNRIINIKESIINLIQFDFFKYLYPFL